MPAKLILPLLSAFVFYAIFYYAIRNGAKDLMDTAVLAQTIPGTKFALRTFYTGLPHLDELLTQLTVVFWPVTDGSHPALFLHSIAFSGTFCSAWVLVTIESWRKGNAGTILPFAIFFGLAAQVLTFAFATPLYLSLQLLTSVTAEKPTADNIRAPSAVLKALPYVFLVGMLVPSNLMVLPLSETITPDLKQIFIALWQPWPAYVAVLLYIANLFFSGNSNAASQTVEKSRSNLRHVYAFAFGNAIIAHQLTVVLSLTTVAAPFLFQKRFAEALHPFKVFETPLPWASPAPQVESVGQGMHEFLRWDYIIGSTGVLVWALSVYRAAHKNANRPVNILGLAVKTALLSIFGGPVAAAVELVWERDELVFDQAKKTVVKAK